ncbi:MAG: SUMF1/EgtB/PvdO family nonheme iron enzyme [Polyangiaceae bacterium]
MRLYRVLSARGASAEEVGAVRAIFEASPYLGQGNPEVSVHPMTRAECRQKRAEAQIAADDQAACGKKYMVPVWDPEAGGTRESAKVCIDQYEFPGVPCEYPVVNVRANEAAAICRAVGERLCDAHEWEGACAGAVREPSVEYMFDHDRRYSSGMHNLKRQIVWAYGAKKNHLLCGTTSFKTKGCPGGGWKQCGSNTFPAGSFPECKSPFGVYDQHGNAAEHMNLPTRAEELMSAGAEGGVTEMKGSWFIFAKGEPHLDDCRWREPSWHESRVSDPNSHRNYHLGFRCCRDRGGQ